MSKALFRRSRLMNRKKPNRAAAMAFSLLLVVVLFFTPLSSLQTSADQVYYQTHILGFNTWNDDNNKTVRPQSISVRLFADGSEVDQRFVSGDASVWDFDFGEWETYHSGIPIQYSVVMDPVKNYSYTSLVSPEAGKLLYNLISTHQLIIINHRLRAAGHVGDDMHIVFWGALLAGSVIALAGFLLFFRRD